MFQEIKTFRDFIEDDHSKQFALMPLQMETCMLLKAVEKDDTGLSRIVLRIFDSETHYIGTIERPHFIPNKNN